jgi:hypothetical protein
MKKAIALLSLLLIGCAQPQTAPVVTPTQAPSLVAPGKSAIPNSWTWGQQTKPTEELTANLAALKTPADIGYFLQTNFPWQDTYDTSVFLSPNDLVKQKYGVCSAFARFWNYALARQGIQSNFIAFWGPNSAHAVCVFFNPTTHKWEMGSNQYYYGASDLAPGVSTLDGKETAIINAAKTFYGDKWSYILVYEEGGQIIQKLTNDKAPTEFVPGDSSRNIFSIQK